jgi:hypothetical protein
MEDWKKHLIVLIIATIVLQPILFWIYVTNQDVFMQFIILTLTTNVLSLIYAVYIFRLYDKGTQKVIKKIKELGIDPPSYENLFINFYEKIKPYLDAIKDEDIKPEDIKRLIEFIKTFGRPRPQLTDKEKEEILKIIRDKK